MVTKKAIALGTFDGLHKGHRSVLAFANGYDLTVLTFRYPPKSMSGGAKELLMLPDDKKKALLDFGAEKVIFLDFDRIKDMSAVEFLKYLKETYAPDLICCGFDFHFGKDAKGDTRLIEKFFGDSKTKCAVSAPVFEGGKPISSTVLRELVKNGKVNEANKQIFGGFGFTFEVIHGDARGRTIGYPTINGEYPSDLVLPEFGVYASEIIIDGKTYKCVTNIGVRPTFKTEKVYCESYVIGFNRDVYGEFVTLKPKKFLRKEQKFNSLNELTKAIKEDITKL